MCVCVCVCVYLCVCVGVCLCVCMCVCVCALQSRGDGVREYYGRHSRGLKRNQGNMAGECVYAWQKFT